MSVNAVMFARRVKVQVRIDSDFFCYIYFTLFGTKSEGDECGGSYGLKGRCSTGLACYSYEEPEQHFSFAPRGICGKYNIDKDQNCLLFEYEVRVRPFLPAKLNFLGM